MRPRVFTMLAAMAVVSALAVPGARADSSGSTTVSITLAVRSLTVSPSSESLDGQCTDASHNATPALVTPNGSCGSATGVNITYGQIAGHVYVQGSDAIPSDNGRHWTLCGGTGTTCTGASGQPGQDQFDVVNVSPSGVGPWLSNTPQCDTAYWSGACAASANDVRAESFLLTAPSVSTDGSTQFTTVFTWTAVP